MSISRHASLFVRHRLRSRLFTLAVGLAIACVAGQAIGQDRLQRVVFVLEPSSPSSDSPDSFEALKGQLDELSVALIATRGRLDVSLRDQALIATALAEDQNAPAAVWFGSVEEGGEVRIYALHVASGRVFVRVLQVSEEAVLQREQLAVVLRATIPAVLSGGQDLGTPLFVLERKAPESRGPRVAPPTPPTKEAPSTTKARGPRALVGYSGTSIAPGVPWQSGVAGEVLVDLSDLARAGVGASYEAPVSFSRDGAEAEIGRVPMVVRVGVPGEIADVLVGVEAGFLSEVWLRRTVRTVEELSPSKEASVWRWGGTLGIRVELPLAWRTGVSILVESQWLPATHTLSVRTREGTSDQATRSLRPHVALASSFDFSSAGRRADGAR